MIHYSQEQKKKTSLESFMFSLGIGQIILSRSIPSFEALPLGLENTRSAIGNA
jgi:hypothetical protein